MNLRYGIKFYATTFQAGVYSLSVALLFDALIAFPCGIFLAVQTEHSQRGVGVCASYHEHHHAAGVSAGSVSDLSRLIERVVLHHR